MTHHFYDGYEDVRYDLEFVFAGERYSHDEEERVAEGIRVLEQHLEVMESKLASARMTQKMQAELRRTTGGGA